MSNDCIPEIPDTKYHKFVKWICILMQTGIILFLFFFWNRLPDKIPMHYNAAGEIDSYGGRWTVWIIPAVMILMYLFMHIVERHPRWWNTSVTITRENCGRVYLTLKNCIVSFKFVLTFIFAYMSISEVTGTTLGKWFLPVTLMVTFVPMIVFAILLVPAAK